MLEGFTRDIRSGSRVGLIGAARRAYLLALAALAGPGVLLGVVLALGRPTMTPLLAAVVLYALAAALATWALRRARQAAFQLDRPIRSAALGAAIQAATAPGVVFLLGCTLAHQPVLLAGFWVTAGLLHWRVWSWLPTWVREPEPLVPSQESRLPST